MLPRGRPPGPGTAEEKAAIRREKVRLNVKAYRERKRKAQAAVAPPTSSRSSSYSEPSSSASGSDSVSDRTDSDDQSGIDPKNTEIVIRARPPFVSNSRQIGQKPENWSPVDSVFWASPDTGPIFSSAFLSHFRCAFLPYNVFLPAEAQRHSSLVTPCSPWITNAYKLAMNQDSGALRSGLVAVGLNLSRSQDSNNDLKVASLQMHRKALSQLRKDLGPITLHRQSKRSSANVMVSYLSCLAVAMFELVQTGFSPNFLQHLNALNTLIELMYADPNIDRFTTDLIVEDFGMLEMIFCLKFGFDSVLKHTRHRVAALETSGYRKNASVYGDILDIVEDLPTLMTKIKTIRSQQHLPSSFDDLKDVVRKISGIQGEMDAGMIEFEARHGTIMSKETFSDEISGERGIRHRLRSYEHGAAAVFLFSFQLRIIESNIEATTLLNQLRRLRISQTNLAQRSVSSELDVLSIDQAGAIDLEITSTEKESVLFRQQLGTQRIKVRTLARHLVDVMDQFSMIASNLSGHSLMVGPCDWLREVFSKEQKRLDADMQHLQAGEHEEVFEVAKHAEELQDIRDSFAIVELRLQQHQEYGPMHGG